ncbi:thioredoxin family protein [Cupriavidus sp. YAF13]|uniref:thioredoxin family protein n=1 Tax=Cupriavidus sp. YAF13 TaxID=3233075 RepID=UPI003F8FD349
MVVLGRRFDHVANVGAGKEYDRLIGPSTMRLRLMMERWFRELGLTVPTLERASVENLDASSQTVRVLKSWNSFGGDATVKAAGLARLRECTEEEEYLPSARLSRDEEQFEAIVDVPAALGDLLDTLYWIQSHTDEKIAPAQTLEIVDAMPVGADLGTVAAKALYHLLYTSPWEITQYFANGIASIPSMQIKMRHQREHVGERVALADWEALQRETVLLTGSGLDSRMSVELERLAVSLIDEGMARDVLPLVIEYAVRDYRQYPEWSEAEATRITGMLDEDFEQVREALGDRPKDEGSARDEWYAQLSDRLGLKERERRVAQPELWARYDAWCKFKQATITAICAHVAAVLLSLLRVAAK